MNYIVQRPCFADSLALAYAQGGHGGIDSQHVAIVFAVLALGASMDLSMPACEGTSRPANLTADNEKGEELFAIARAALTLSELVLLHSAEVFCRQRRLDRLHSDCSPNEPVRGKQPAWARDIYRLLDNSRDSCSLCAIGTCAVAEPALHPVVADKDQLGLHRDGARWGLEGTDADVRRRVFWEIFTEDALQSMTQGRPKREPRWGGGDSPKC